MGDKITLQRYLERAIPLVQGMQVTVREVNPERVVLTAPFAPNTNHQSTAFGGSVASLATLACWGWLWNHLREPDADTVHAKLVIARAEIDYLKPIASDLTAVCQTPEEGLLNSFEDTYARRGRGRITLTAMVTDDEGTGAARFVGQFAAMKSG